VAQSSRLDMDELKKHLATKVIGQRVEYHERIPSTTAAGKELCASCDVADLHGTVILPRSRPAGTGRLGRAWVSPPGGIWFT